MGELTPKLYLSRPPKDLESLEKLLKEDKGKKFDKKFTKILINYIHRGFSKDFNYENGIYTPRK